MQKFRTETAAGGASLVGLLLMYVSDCTVVCLLREPHMYSPFFYLLGLALVLGSFTSRLLRWSFSSRTARGIQLVEGVCLLTYLIVCVQFLTRDAVYLRRMMYPEWEAWAHPPKTAPRSVEGINPASLAILTLEKEDASDVDGELLWNKMEYCSMHDYQFFNLLQFYKPLVDLEFKQGYGKILALEHALFELNFEWVLWIDRDVVIMDSSFEVHRLVDDRYDMIIGDALNNGVFFLRRSSFMKTFLPRWHNYTYDPTIRGDNASLVKLFESDAEFRSRVKLIPQAIFNSYPSTHDPKLRYMKGDFLAHFAGDYYRETRFEVYLRLANKIPTGLQEWLYY